MKKQNVGYLILGRIAILVSLVVSLAFAIWMQGQTGKLDAFLHDIAWINLIFWTVILVPILVISFRKTSYKNPSFCIVTSWVLPFLTYLAPLFFMSSQLSV